MTSAKCRSRRSEESFEKAFLVETSSRPPAPPRVRYRQPAIRGRDAVTKQMRDGLHNYLFDSGSNKSANVDGSRLGT